MRIVFKSDDGVPKHGIDYCLLKTENNLLQ